MNAITKPTATSPDEGRVASICRMSPDRKDKLDIAGHQYVTAAFLADMLGVTVRTLARWDAARIGPPKIKIGKLRLYDLDKLPQWLSSQETEPVGSRSQSHSRRSVQ